MISQNHAPLTLPKWSSYVPCRLLWVCEMDCHSLAPHLSQINMRNRVQDSNVPALASCHCGCHYRRVRYMSSSAAQRRPVRFLPGHPLEHRQHTSRQHEVHRCNSCRGLRRLGFCQAMPEHHCRGRGQCEERKVQPNNAGHQHRCDQLHPERHPTRKELLRGRA